MLKQVFHPHLGHTITFGRRVPKVLGPHMRASRYTAKLPAAPPTLDYTKAAMPSLTQALGNITLGDCVIAGGYHIEGVATANAGKIFIPTQQQIIADYSTIGGYVPGNPATDQGCDLQTAMNYWTQHGFANGTKLLGYLSVNPTDKAQMQQVLWLFENLYFGVGLPDSWIAPFPSSNGFVWNNGPVDLNNGHCFPGCGYTQNGILIDTWGLIGTVTWDAVASVAAMQNGGELYVMLTPDIIAKGQAKAPNGFDWATLIADFNALGGRIPLPTPPAPTPAPAPVPAPGAPPSLAQAQAWAAAGLATNWPK